jgi:Tfp pilus assembly protein PilX
MVLLLCLLFLIALTLLGLSASADAILQSQLAANLQEKERAKQSALAALSWAEDWVLDLEGTAPESCLTPCEGFKLHPAGDLIPHPEFEGLSWWRSQGYEAGIDPLTGARLITFAANSVNPPMWIIEVVHENPAADDGATDARAWYRILVRASGSTDRAIAVIESTVTRPWSSDESSGTADKGRVSWRELR